MFQREQIFSMTDVAKYTEKTADNMNVMKNQLFFWTNHQKSIVDSNQKRVLFTSEFGTGKTTLLKAKATQLGKERRNHHLKNKTNQNDSSAGQVLFVVFTGHEALLTQSLKLDLEELKEHVKIVSLTSKLMSSKLTTIKLNYIKS
jgi:type II secretory pathway predicted ATPase ExeA